MPLRLRASLFVLLLAAAGSATHAQQAAPQPPPPQFRTGISLVPLDVRVVDRLGYPVTDLKESDFTILENGRPQVLRHFSTVDLGVPGTPQPLHSDATSDALVAPPTRRVFLFVLGRGRLQPPGRGADAAVDFMKKHVLPQDYVAVLAWNRATSFSTDHATTLGVLERFRQHHEGVEAAMAQHFSGLAALYAGPEIPAKIQSRIDAVFTEPGQSLPAPGGVLTPGGAQADRRTQDAMLTNELRAAVGGGGFLTAVGEDADSLGIDMSFDEYIEATRQTAQDMTNLYAGISYMRHLTGEKHLVFVTQSGLTLPAAEDDKSIAAQAADARVAMSILHTGGTSPTNTWSWSTNTSQRVAAMTGGQFTSVMRGPQFMARLDRSSRFQYVLGYTPDNPTLDGQFRRIQVRVNRRNVQVLSRSGYFARTAPPLLEPRMILAQSRIAAGALSARAVTDLGVEVAATMPKAGAGPSYVDLTITVKSDRVRLEPSPDGTTRVTLEVAMFCGDSRNRIVGQAWNTVAVNLSPAALARFHKFGMQLTGRVDVTTAPHNAKVVVYDPGTDLLGVAITRIDK